MIKLDEYPITEEFTLESFPNIKNHPDLEIIEEHIWVIHNFTTPEERQTYVNVGEAATEEEWHAHNHEWWIGKFLPLPQEIEDSLVPPIVERIKNILGDERIVIGSPRSVHRMHEGQYMFDHADNPTEDSGKNNHVLTSFVLYHNEFNGGNIYYKHLGIEYHPQPGDLVIHPGTERYRHGTRPVEAGPTRYVSTMWAYDPEVVVLHQQGRVFDETDDLNPMKEVEISRESK